MCFHFVLLCQEINERRDEFREWERESHAWSRRVMFIKSEGVRQKIKMNHVLSGLCSHLSEEEARGNVNVSVLVFPVSFPPTVPDWLKTAVTGQRSILTWAINYSHECTCGIKKLQYLFINCHSKLLMSDTGLGCAGVSLSIGCDVQVNPF